MAWRRPSASAADLAQAGLTIVSGMARGIDYRRPSSRAEAKTGTPSRCLGCGVDVLYPANNRKLYDDIARKGVCCSPSFPWALPPTRRISLSATASSAAFPSALLIVEGAQYSGSAITAKLAMDQGREVFAVPGNITSKMSWGPNLLIKEGGAKLVQEWTRYH